MLRNFLRKIIQFVAGKMLVLTEFDVKKFAHKNNFNL